MIKQVSHLFITVIGPLNDLPLVFGLKYTAPCCYYLFDGEKTDWSGVQSDMMRVAVLGM